MTTDAPIAADAPGFSASANDHHVPLGALETVARAEAQRLSTGVRSNDLPSRALPNGPPGRPRRFGSAAGAHRREPLLRTREPDPARFYAGRTGAVVADILRARLASMWPNLRHQQLLGLGHVEPFLDLWRDQTTVAVAARLGAGAPSRAGTPLPVGSGAVPSLPAATAVVAPDALPFADLSMDRILLVHGLERAPDAGRLLRECWRVLRDDGRLLVAVPNRVGLWAHVEATPLGRGQPYTAGQLAELFGDATFAMERCEHALFVPPVGLRAVLRAAPFAERLGRRLLPRLGGVILAEAVKDMYAAVPLREAGRRRIVAIPRLRAVRAA